MTETLKYYLRKDANDEGVVHVPQNTFVNSGYKRIIIKAGRRGGKTVGIAKRHIIKFLNGSRVLYGAPTITQVETYWREVKRALREPISKGYFKCNETEKYIEIPGTEQRIKAKTCWNAETIRGDYGDEIALDEFQLMNEDIDDIVLPMLMDTNGTITYIFTPPSLKNAMKSRAKDPRHASKLFKKAQADTTDRWQHIHFTSYDNPFLTKEAIEEVMQDMTPDGFRREIMAMDDDIEDSWLVYSKFNERYNKCSRFSIPKHWKHRSGHDFGQANPGALFISENTGPEEIKTSTGGLVRIGDHVAWYEYMPGSGMDTARNVNNFKEAIGNWEMTESVGGNRTTEEEIREAYRMHDWNIQAPKIKDVGPQVDRVIGLMELDKIHIFEDMTYLLVQLANCLWVIDADNMPTNKIDNESKYHLLACLRYWGTTVPIETMQTEDWSSFYMG